jgi:hypothetical protein
MTFYGLTKLPEFWMAVIHFIQLASVGNFWVWLVRFGYDSVELGIVGSGCKSWIAFLTSASQGCLWLGTSLIPEYILIVNPVNPKTLNPKSQNGTYSNEEKWIWESAESKNARKQAESSRMEQPWFWRVPTVFTVTNLTSLQVWSVSWPRRSDLGSVDKSNLPESDTDSTSMPHSVMAGLTKSQRGIDGQGLMRCLEGVEVGWRLSQELDQHTILLYYYY